MESLSRYEEIVLRGAVCSSIVEAGARTRSTKPKDRTQVLFVNGSI